MTCERVSRAARLWGAVLGAGVGMFIGCVRNDGPVAHAIVVDVAEGWREVEPGPPLALQAGTNGGWLHISLQPGGEARTLSEALADTLKTTGLDLGETVAAVETHSDSGPMALSVHQSPERGVLGFWLIDAGPVRVFASFTMGDLDRAAADMKEAQRMVRHLRVERTTSPLISSPDS